MYQLQISRDAQKSLALIKGQDYLKIVAAINDLANNPRPSGCKKLKGRLGYRIRQGNYRVIYEIEDKQLLVLKIDLGLRKNIYG